MKSKEIESIVLKVGLDTGTGRWMRYIQMPVGYDQIPELTLIAKLDSSYHEILDSLLLGLEIIIIFYLSFSGIGWWLLSVMT
jgi:hypothetical protein